MGLLVVGASFTVTAPAGAQEAPSAAPPGNSAVDQYRESLPASAGGARELSRRDRAGLARQGRDGERLAAVLERSGGVPRPDRSAGQAPSDGSGARGGGGSGPTRDADGADRTPATDDRSASPTTRSVAPAAAASTVGPVPVWAMLIAAAVLVGVGLAVRVRASRP